MTTYDAILPAGGTIDPAFANVVGTPNKALIRFGEQTVLERVIEALRASGRIRRIATIGPEIVRESPGAASADLLLEPGETGPENILRGLDALSAHDAPDKVLVVTTDLPFLTPDTVHRFLDACPTGADICLPLISREAFVTQYPQATATFVRLADGEWTAGCMYLLDVQALRRSQPYIERVFANRKNKLGMARLLGPTFLIRFLTKKLTIDDLEAKIQSMLGCSGKALRGSPPELAYDIDDLIDYEYAKRHLEGLA